MVFTSMRFTRLCVADILFWRFVETLLAARRAEIVGLPFVFRPASGCIGVNFHAANGVFHQHHLASIVLSAVEQSIHKYCASSGIQSAI